MKLLYVDDARVLHLYTASRRAGSYHLPGLLRQVLERYSFVSGPSTAEDFASDRYVFKNGRFGDVGIAELSVYGDGLLARSRCDTAVLEKFVDDLIAWHEHELGIEVVKELPVTRFLFSTLIVQFDSDPFGMNEALSKVGRALKSKLSNLVGDSTAHPLYSVGFELPLRSKPGETIRMKIERRAGVDPGLLVFYSEAPLSVAEHLDVLSELESVNA